MHAIARGFKPGPRSRIGPLELYDSGRYFTVTGRHIAGTPLTVEVRTSEIAILYAKMFPPEEEVVKANGHGSSNKLTDESILSRAKASKNGQKFSALWSGDLSGHDNDHSKADAALCSILAYWTNRDAEKMDRLFRQSKLMRPKWDEKRGVQRYSEKTIALAIVNTAVGFDPDGRVEFILASDVQTVKLEWLWHARLALGAITLFEGGPEKGKSTILVDLAARVTTGESFPGEMETRQPGNVVMLIAEDDIQTTVVPRLIAAGADLGRVSFLGATKDEKGDVVPFQMSDDCERLRIECARFNATFIVVDPLVSYLGSRKGRVLNTNNDLEVRKALGPLKELAERLRASVAAIRHYRKGAGTDAMEAGGGSVGFAALVRVIVAALPDPDDPSKYLLAVAKNNLVAKNKRPALSYEIIPSKADPSIGSIAWGEKMEMSAGEILQAQAVANRQAEKETEPHGKTGEALAFLETFLADEGWHPTVDIMKTAKELHGLSEFAVRRAKEKTTIQVEKQGRQWFWRLHVSGVTTSL
ncbi:MAG: AAA family ATPase [Gemmatimonadota bacterium]